jgi:hypothetical protein
MAGKNRLSFNSFWLSTHTNTHTHTLRYVTSARCLAGIHDHSSLLRVSISSVDSACTTPEITKNDDISLLQIVIPRYDTPAQTSRRGDTLFHFPFLSFMSHPRFYLFCLSHPWGGHRHPDRCRLSSRIFSYIRMVGRQGNFVEEIPPFYGRTKRHGRREDDLDG